MKLIKQLIDELNTIKTTSESKFPEAERVARELGLTEDNDTTPDPKKEASRIAAYWRSKAGKMTDSELRNAIGNDLEQLEYSPEQVNSMVSKILKLVKK